MRPATVQISPGVYVVEDYDDSVFYADGWYWRYDGYVWYRSSYHSHGWVRHRHVPRAVVTIHNPRGYVRYRGNARGNGTVRVRGDRDHRDGRGSGHVAPRNDRPTTRDHRGATPVRVAPPKRDVDRRDNGTNSRGKSNSSKKKVKGPNSRDHR